MRFFVSKQEGIMGFGMNEECINDLKILNNKNVALKARVTFNKADSMLSLPICLTIIGLFLKNSTSIMSLLNETTKNGIDIFVKILILVSLFFSIPSILKRLTKSFAIKALIILGIVLLHIIIFRENNSVFLTTVQKLLLTVFPCVICLSMIRDYSLLYRRLLTCSLVISILNIVVFVVYMRGYFTGLASMGYSMTLLIPLNVLLSDLLITKKTRPLLLMPLILLTFISIFVFGSRGALIAVVFYVLTLFLLNGKKKNGTKMILFI